MGSDHTLQNKGKSKEILRGRKKKYRKPKISFRFKVELCWTPNKVKFSHKKGTSLKEFFSPKLSTSAPLENLSVGLFAEQTWSVRIATLDGV